MKRKAKSQLCCSKPPKLALKAVETQASPPALRLGPSVSKGLELSKGLEILGLHMRRSRDMSVHDALCSDRSLHHLPHCPVMRDDWTLSPDDARLLATLVDSSSSRMFRMTTAALAAKDQELSVRLLQANSTYFAGLVSEAICYDHWEWALSLICSHKDLQTVQPRELVVALQTKRYKALAMLAPRVSTSALREALHGQDCGELLKSDSSTLLPILKRVGLRDLLTVGRADSYDYDDLFDFEPHWPSYDRPHLVRYWIECGLLDSKHSWSTLYLSMPLSADVLIDAMTDRAESHWHKISSSPQLLVQVARKLSLATLIRLRSIELMAQNEPLMELLVVKGLKASDITQEHRLLLLKSCPFVDKLELKMQDLSLDVVNANSLAQFKLLRNRGLSADAIQPLSYADYEMAQFLVDWGAPDSLFTRELVRKAIVANDLDLVVLLYNRIGHGRSPQQFYDWIFAQDDDPAVKLNCL